MNEYEKSYYYKMRDRDRLVRLEHEGKFCGVLTYFVGNGNVDKYVRDDSWSVVDDEQNGNRIYIDHLLTTKEHFNKEASLHIWHWLKRYFKSKHPQVTEYRWNRFMNGKVYVRQGRL